MRTCLLLALLFLALVAAPTAAAAPAQITGRVVLEGRTDYGGTIIRSGGLGVTTAPDGTFALSYPSTGVIQIDVVAPGYLPARAIVSISPGQPIALPELVLFGGDINGDGAINILDLVLVGAEFGKPAPGNPVTDLTHDNRVNIFDLIILGRNYGLIGPMVWGTAPVSTATPTLAPNATPTVPPTGTSTPTLAPSATPTSPAVPLPTSSPTTAQPSSQLGIWSMDCAGPDEWVEIVNFGATDQALAGWELRSVAGSNRFTFPSDAVVAAGGWIRVTSGPGGRDQPPQYLLWTSSSVWSDSGDTAELYDAQGKLVASRSCASQAPTATATPTLTPTTSPTSTSDEILCTRVIDGDTIELATGEHVRLIGIDTPEMDTADCYALEATLKTIALVQGKMVRLEKDVSETDRYGRLLRYVYVGGLFVNAELVRQGYAQVYTYPPDVQYAGYFVQLQQEARDAGRGLWSACVETATPTASLSPTPTATPTGGQSTAPITGTSLMGDVRVDWSCCNVDTAGNDHEQTEAEYVCFRNYAFAAIDVTGWYVLDLANHKYTFSVFWLGAGQSVRLHTGSGMDTATDVYWGRGQAVWNNPIYGGDTIMLYDSAGTLVERSEYPAA